MIETAHPYGNGKNQLKEFVHFPGAVALFVSFSPLCATASRNDYLKLYKVDFSLSNYSVDYFLLTIL